MEHQLLTETFGTLLAVAAVAVAVAAPLSTPWRAVGVGVLVAVLATGATLVRPAFLLFAPGLLMGLASAASAAAWRWRTATAACAAFGATFAILGGSYVLVQEHHTGYRGFIGPSIDLGAYPGMAPIADCRRFHVPAGTESLCHDLPRERRPGPDHYYFDGSSPGLRLAAARPDLLSAIDTWGRRASVAQRGDLWRSRWNAFRGLLGLGGTTRPATDYGPSELRLSDAAARSAPVTVAAVAAYYGPDAARPRDPGPTYEGVARIQSWTRPPRQLLLPAFVLCLAGVARGRGRLRRAALALSIVAWLPLFVATYTGGQFYTSVPSGQFIWRYALADLPFVGLAAATAGVALAQGLRASRSCRAGAPLPADGAPSAS